ncbi:MAG TPA: GNAT family N-acetyltransferase [Thermodesulfobacteriota bacterium]|nr:GNAT family N-acetyltransferase [Thermodesulfobacteriota bacterium]
MTGKKADKEQRKGSSEPVLVPAGPEHVEELGRICFEAFKGIHDHHNSPRDFPTLEIAVNVIKFFVNRDDIYGVAALVDGKPAGSNFISLSDAVAGVGPITIDPSTQARGIGRALMRDVIDYAKKNGIKQVRLLQDSFNMSSLSLYSSLGFDVRVGVVLMDASQGRNIPQGNVRPAAESDIEAMDGLCRSIYKVSRRNEIAAAMKYGFPPVLTEREGTMTGYLIPGFLGHGVARTEEDAFVLIDEASRNTPHLAKFFCPLSEARFYRESLKRGYRAVKVMNLMSIGHYDPPDEIWMPSVLY